MIGKFNCETFGWMDRVEGMEIFLCFKVQQELRKAENVRLCLLLT
jgi:hypothetical protein